jgi:Spy/CpxP family protein refolding chaperone
MMTTGYTMLISRVMKHLMLTTWILLIAVPPLFGRESYRDFERGLDLSPQQREQMSNIRNRYEGEWRALKDRSMRRRIELRDLDRARADRRARAEEVDRELYEIDAAKHRLYRQYRGEVSSIFTEQQRYRYNDFCERERRRPMGPYRHREHGR